MVGWGTRKYSCFEMFEKPSFQHSDVEHFKTVMWKVVGVVEKVLWEINICSKSQKSQAFIYTAGVMDYKDYSEMGKV